MRFLAYLLGALAIFIPDPGPLNGRDLLACVLLALAFGAYGESK